MEARKLAQSADSPFEFSLRIRHPSIDPQTITDELRLEPEHSFKAGDHRRGPTSSRYGESYWLASLDPIAWSNELLTTSIEPHKLDAMMSGGHLQHMVEGSLGIALSMVATRFLRTHVAFLQKIRSEGGQVSLLIQIEPEGMRSFTLTPEMARAIDKLGLAVEFEFGSTE